MPFPLCDRCVHLCGRCVKPSPSSLLPSNTVLIEDKRALGLHCSEHMSLWPYLPVFLSNFLCLKSCVYFLCGRCVKPFFAYCQLPTAYSRIWRLKSCVFPYAC